jgi:hypothetical protein
MCHCEEHAMHKHQDDQSAADRPDVEGLRGRKERCVDAVTRLESDDAQTGGLPSVLADDSEIPEVPETFSVTDDSSANWVIRRIVEARAYAERVDDWADREKARARREEEFFLYRYGGQLIAWVTAKIALQGGRRKSVCLPAGMAGFRKEDSKIIVDDEAVVLAWAKQHNPGLVVISEKLSKSGLNEHLRNTGELPDAGVHVEPAREKFYVK